jgi:hypothetical protein
VIDVAAPSCTLRLAIRALLSNESGHAEAMPVGAAAVALCERLSRTLEPLVGEAGVSALFARSLHLAKSEFPWLALAQDAAPADAPFTQLRICLGRQTPAVAIEGASAFIAAFCGLLISLIGDAMTRRLLRDAWPLQFHADTPRDPL